MFRFRSTKYVANIRFAQQSRRPKQPSYVDRAKQQEEIDKQTNLQVIKREIFNDSLQLPIKFAAYYLTGQQTFWAELTRSMIDASNHVILYATNNINFGPSKRFPYGIEKLKHLVALIPSSLFLYFGLTISYEAFHNIYNFGHYTGELPDSTWGLALYLLSIGIETSVVFKNIKDAQAVDPADKSKGILSQILSLFSKKDPLLQAVLYENAITMCSTLVPIVSSALTLIYPSHIFEVVGSLIIGLIQLQIAYHLGSKNLSSLMGDQSISQKEVQQILGIIKKNEYISQVMNEKAVMLGSRNFRFTANITFDIDKINKNAMAKYQERVNRVVYTDSYSDSEEYLQKLMLSIQEHVMATIHIQIQNIEAAIRNEFPNCLHLDFEVSHQSLAETYKLDDHNQQVYNLSFQGPDIEKWKLDEANRMIKKYQIKNQNYEELIESIK